MAPPSVLLVPFEDQPMTRLLVPLARAGFALCVEPSLEYVARTRKEVAPGVIVLVPSARMPTQWSQLLPALEGVHVIVFGHAPEQAIADLVRIDGLEIVPTCCGVDSLVQAVTARLQS